MSRLDCQLTFTEPGPMLVTEVCGRLGAPVSGPLAKRVRPCWAAPLTVVNSPPTHRYRVPPEEASDITRGPICSPMPSLVSGNHASRCASSTPSASRCLRTPLGYSPMLEQSWACEPLYSTVSYTWSDWVAPRQLSRQTWLKSVRLNRMRPSNTPPPVPSLAV